MTHVLPTSEEIPALAAGPDSIARRYGDDARIMAAAGYALILQVAHPTVGAGVRDYSDFLADPWGRLLRTLDFTYLMTYGTPEEAALTCRRVREMHQKIKGTTPEGRRYHALEPEAYAWVHATLADAIVRGHTLFGRPMTAAQQGQLWQEWLGLGRLLGVRERDLPGDWVEFGEYFDGMVENTLESNQTVRDVVTALTRPAAPPVPALNERLWRVVRFPIARASRMATIGMLPPLLRERLGLRWTRTNDRELRALGAASRATTPILPRRLRHGADYYLRWRRAAIDRTYLRPEAPAPDHAPVAAA